VSTFALLFYYSFANIASLKLKSKKRLFPKVLPILGLLTCITLMAAVFVVATLAWIIGFSFLAIGTTYYYFRKKHSNKL